MWCMISVSSLLLHLVGVFMIEDMNHLHSRINLFIHYIEPFLVIELALASTTHRSACVSFDTSPGHHEQSGCIKLRPKQHVNRQTVSLRNDACAGQVEVRKSSIYKCRYIWLLTNGYLR
jgi:hypothetical protein